jgi:DNA-binding MarR family transcriptional regulator
LHKKKPEEGYLKKERDYTEREKLLRLTEKGAAVAFLLADIRQKFWHQEWEKLNETLEKKTE